MKGKPYRPSNGTEGDYFIDEFCMNCINCNPDPDGEKQCDILRDTFVFDISDEGYPKQWVYDDNEKPSCTDWIKWDWGNDGDPDDPENPKAPSPPPDPNQVDLFPLYPDETNYSIKKEIEHEIY